MISFGTAISFSLTITFLNAFLFFFVLSTFNPASLFSIKALYFFAFSTILDSDLI
jgi:hypothetical protein